MSYKLTVENGAGEQLTLTANPAYDLIEVRGTNPAAATINTMNLAGYDGSKFNSSKVGMRNIVLSLVINHPIEANRIALYRFFRPKKPVRIYYKNSRRDVYIDGFVETFENNPWTKKQQPQISIICPNPYWASVKPATVSFTKSIPMFEFPFSIPAEGIEFSGFETVEGADIDAGEVETGGIIQMTAIDDVVNPVITNNSTGEFFGIGLELIAGDIVTINTLQGHKSVSLLRDGVVTNILADKLTGSSWITFQRGKNEIGVSAFSGVNNLRVFCEVVPLFEGV